MPVMHLKTTLIISHIKGKWLGVECDFQQSLNYIVAVIFIGGENRSTRRKPPNGRKSLTNFNT